MGEGATVIQLVHQHLQSADEQDPPSGGAAATHHTEAAQLSRIGRRRRAASVE